MSEESGQTTYRARTQYVGEVASGYDAERQRSRYARWRWNAEISRLSAAVAAIGTDLLMLDMPVGTGRMVPELQHHGTVIGGDVSVDMLTLARDNRVQAGSSLDVVASDALQLPFGDDTFDLVVSIRFFQHLPEPVVIGALREFSRVARKGVFVQTPLTQPISPLIQAAARGYARLRGRPGSSGACPADRFFPTTAAEFDRVAAAAGLTIESATPVNWRWGQLRLAFLTDAS